MKIWDAIVVGGGAAGLSAAGELARGGARVLLLEARRAPGGRIRTIRPRGWPLPVELGAEFVHGADPELLGPARREGLLLDRLPPEHLERRGDGWRPVRGTWRRFEAATRAMRDRGPDRSVAEFLASGRVGVRDRRLLRGMFEGFEAAPIHRLSERSLSTAGEEAGGEEERTQFRFTSGYDGVVRALAREAESRGAGIRCGTAVRAIAWRRGRVEVRTARTVLHARRTIVSVSVGVPGRAPRARRAARSRRRSGAAAAPRSRRCGRNATTAPHRFRASGSTASPPARALAASRGAGPRAPGDPR